MSWLPVLFVVIPFTELVILLEVGELWGALPTLGLIITTAFIGYNLFKRQGIKTWQLVQTKLSQGELPSREMAEGIIILMAGTLMITPGLLTDFVGLFCLIPITRKLVLTLLMKRFKSKVHIQTQYSYHSQQTQKEAEKHSGVEKGRTIDGDYSRDDQ
ncbi:FxsA family protein [Pleionea sediminis]|uniref:FxsA family protein n=1 Tax=Pleionea sediminis TaxID=2569479 RepID=UPI00118530A4|nr:FxsA family protein [Pleionea sediminis]